jgi:hypothetical protein
MGARYYQPGTGRFTQLDPLPTSVFEGNRYHYTGGNPVNYTDPTGLHTWPGTCRGRDRIESGYMWYRIFMNHCRSHRVADFLMWGAGGIGYTSIVNTLKRVAWSAGVGMFALGSWIWWRNGPRGVVVHYQVFIVWVQSQ